MDFGEDKGTNDLFLKLPTCPNHRSFLGRFIQNSHKIVILSGAPHRFVA
jgi:hypothetical protein